MTRTPIYQPQPYQPPADYVDSGPHVPQRHRWPPPGGREPRLWRRIAGLLTLRHFPGPRGDDRPRGE